MDNKTEQYKKIIMPIIEKYLPEVHIILYGSRARHDNKEGSDIDIALDSGKAIDVVLISKIMSDVESSKLPIPFDIIDFYSVSEEMQEKIKKDGVIWKR